MRPSAKGMTGVTAELHKATRMTIQLGGATEASWAKMQTAFAQKLAEHMKVEPEDVVGRRCKLTSIPQGLHS